MSIEKREALAQATPDFLVATSSIRPGEWLVLFLVYYGLVAFVSDEDYAEAAQMFPDVPVREISNLSQKLEAKPCAN